MDARQGYFPTLPKPPLPAGVLVSSFALVASFTVLFAVTLCTKEQELERDVVVLMES